MYMVENHLAIKKNEIMSFVGKYVGIGDQHVKQNKPGLERQISHFFLSYADSRAKIHIHTYTT
jgi:hypothetical protein